MPQPQRHPHFPGKVQKFQRVRKAAARTAPVLLFGGEFQVGQHKAGVGQHPPRARLVPRARSVQGGVKALGPQRGKQCRHKLTLRQRLAAGHGHPAFLFDVGRAAAYFLQKALHRGLFTPAKLPGVRVVAVGAA